MVGIGTSPMKTHVTRSSKEGGLIQIVENLKKYVNLRKFYFFSQNTKMRHGIYFMFYQKPLNKKIFS